MSACTVSGSNVCINPIIGISKAKTFTFRKNDDLGFGFDRSFVYFSTDTNNKSKSVIREISLQNLESWQNPGFLLSSRRIGWLENRNGVVCLAVHKSWLQTFGPDSKLFVRNYQGEEIKIDGFQKIFPLDDEQYKFVESVYANYRRYCSEMMKKFHAQKQAQKV